MYSNDRLALGCVTRLFALSVGMIVYFDLQI